MKQNLIQAKGALNEITDKQFINETLKKVETISFTSTEISEYEGSIFAKLKPLFDDYLYLEKEFNFKINNITNQIMAIKIPSKGFLGLNSWKREIELVKKNKLEVQFKIETETKNEVLKNHSLFNTIEEIKKGNIEYETINLFITEIEEKFKTKYTPKSTINKIVQQDPMLEQCAKLLLSSNKVSSSLLQRRFNLGFNRATKIIEQLVEFGIVKKTNNGLSYELSYKSESELKKILTEIKK